MPRNGVAVRIATAALIALFALAVFSAARSYGFLDYDDGDYVFRNPHLRQGDLPERVRWAWTSFHAANWHPLTWLSFIADDALFGLDPAWCHRENLLLHGINAALAFAVLARLTGSAGPSAVAALLFALHPLRVESVAWITERKGLLMALFALLTLSAHAAYARRPGPGRYLGVMVLFAGSLLAKPQAVALPLALLAADWWPLGRLGPLSPLPRRRVVVFEKAPLLLLAGIAAVLTIAAQRQAGAVAPLGALGVGERLAAATVAPAAYLAKTLWPAGLAPAYPFAPSPWWQVAGALAVLVGLTAAALRKRATQPWLIAGWLGFLVLLAPVSNVLQAGGQALADRYTYLPHIPLFVAVVWSGWAATREAPRARAIAAAASLLLVGALAGAASRQTRFWRDDLTLFSRAVAVTDGNWKMHYNLGNTLARLGREEEAMGQYRLALEARPEYPEALNNLGAVLGRRGEVETAARLFSRAVSLQPGYGPGWLNLGNQSEQAGNLVAALQHYRRAAALQPGAAEPLVRAGKALARLGRRDEAAAACSQALRLDPGSGGAAACLNELAPVPPEK